jgi:hypothetical protein
MESPADLKQVKKIKKQKNSKSSFLRRPGRVEAFQKITPESLEVDLVILAPMS